jgi:hypothetical protein
MGFSDIGAGTLGTNIHITYNQDISYYVENLAHEFVHIAMGDKYVNSTNYSFLKPEDFAFRYLMEEAFAKAMGIWARLSYPDLPTDRQIRGWESQPTEYTITEAMRNDYQVRYPSYSEDQIAALVAAKMLNVYLT